MKIWVELAAVAEEAAAVPAADIVQEEQAGDIGLVAEEAAEEVVPEAEVLEEHQEAEDYMEVQYLLRRHQEELRRHQEELHHHQGELRHHHQGECPRHYQEGAM